jgi:hypothetical protein
MFKWACLGVAVVFLGVVGWMINDIRLQVRQSAAVIDTAGDSINEALPDIVKKSRLAGDTLAKNLPEVVERTRTTTETVAKTLPELARNASRAAEELAELAEDIRQLKELAGVTTRDRDKSLIAYGNSLLRAVESSGGQIGVKKSLGKGLKNPQDAREWAVGARKEALFLSLLVKSKKEMLTRLAKTKLGFYWYIQLPGKEPVRLLDWLKENHPESKELAAGAGR